MTKRINRRQFLFNSLAGAATVTAGLAGLSYKSPSGIRCDKVRLGNTGLVVPRIAMGTGTNGSRRSSNQTRIGLEEFMKIARHAYDRGISFFDMADLYGSHTFVREFLKQVPREEIVLLSKLWTLGGNWMEPESPEAAIDRFRVETGSDYIDIVMLHCLVNGKWQEEKKAWIDVLAKAKQDGVIRATGVSCHNIEALRQASEDPWVDTIMARINPFSSHMDGTPDEIVAILENARRNGKGIVGMKILGQGLNVTPAEREQAFRFAVRNSNIHCMTIGFEKVAHVDDAVDGVMANV